MITGKGFNEAEIQIEVFFQSVELGTMSSILKQLQERSKRNLSSTVTYLSVITFVMGASIHLVGDSVNHRLQHFGYLNHLSVAENPLMKQLRPPELDYDDDEKEQDDNDDDLTICRYLVTEGQIYPLFLAVYAAMLVYGGWQVKTKSLWPDTNGSFLFLTFTLTLALTQVWVAWLWNDSTLRQKYPGPLYMPEPWAYYTLYIAKH
ncbi:hypothetical protein C0Q70_19889 [Pomacea canaliculata]|uniref:Uncharacterized protein n=1 Tax=Pomacea canaliculata TaxID=400727 RepID=A0A2T7NE09_POMCA|nr:hypothetical protein C0Q70_19889 [Pomacea canaliculata]